MAKFNKVFATKVNIVKIILVYDPVLTERNILLLSTAAYFFSLGPPEITSPGMALVLARGDNVTMQCLFTSNPVERVYKWQHTTSGTTIFPDNMDPHYTVTPGSLTIHRLLPSDAGVYLCNVTNQCGSDSIVYHLQLIGK